MSSPNLIQLLFRIYFLFCIFFHQSYQIASSFSFFFCQYAIASKPFISCLFVYIFLRNYNCVMAIQCEVTIVYVWLWKFTSVAIFFTVDFIKKYKWKINVGVGSCNTHTHTYMIPSLYVTCINKAREKMCIKVCSILILKNLIVNIC